MVLSYIASVNTIHVSHCSQSVID